MINSLFRKKGRTQYRFNEATIQKKIIQMTQLAHKNMSNRLESTFRDESLLDRSSTIGEGGTMTGRILKKKIGTISPHKFTTPVKKNNIMLNNPIMVGS